MSAQYWQLGSAVTLLSTELNSLATAGGVISSVGGASGLFNNVYGGGGIGGYVLANVGLYLPAPGGTLTAGTNAQVWFIGTIDGTNYEDGSASVTPARSPDVIIPVRAASGAQRIIVPNVTVPANTWYVLLYQSTGQTWASSLNTLKILPLTVQSL